MRSRFVSVLSATAITAVAFALAGCQSGPQQTDGDGNSLSIIWKGSEQAGIDAVLEQYAKDFPDVDVTLSTADVEQLQSTLRTQLSAGTAPDVMFVWPGNGNPASIQQIAPGGFLEDLSDREWADQYPASLEPLTQVEGATYLMAPTVTAFGGWYNTDAVAEAGLSVPTTWDEVLQFCADARDAGKSAYALGAQTLNANQNILYSLVPSLVYGQDPDFDEQLAAGETSFAENEGWVEAMEKMQEMSDSGCFQDSVTGTSADQANQAAARGDSLATVAIGYTLSALADAAPDVTWEFQALPATADAEDTLLAASSAGGAAVNADAANKERAIEFVDYLASPEVMKIYNDALKGAVPSISTDQPESEDPSLATITSYLDAGKTVAFLDQNWSNARIQQAMYSGVQAMLSGSQSGSEVLAAMDAEYGD